MNPKIHQLLTQITSLEDELRTALHEQEERLLYHVNGKRIEFSGTIRETHRRLKMGLFRWVAADRPQNLLTGPFIYGLIVPLLILDASVTLYQAICFPVYGIAKPRRSHYITMDRSQLGYLNAIERFHCAFCAYANGLLAYTCEIAARTEQYFCPIKHAHRMLGSSARQDRFLAYGDATDYHQRLEQYRVALEKDSAP
jgi:hypothetical protein